MNENELTFLVLSQHSIRRSIRILYNVPDIFRLPG